MSFIKPFNQISWSDRGEVGGKNSSLGKAK